MWLTSAAPCISTADKNHSYLDKIMWAFFKFQLLLGTECLVWQVCFFSWILTECHISCGWPTGHFAWHSLHNHLVAAAWFQVVSELPHCWLSTHATYWSLTTDTDWNLILVKFTVKSTYEKYVITKTKKMLKCMFQSPYYLYPCLNMVHKYNVNGPVSTLVNLKSCAYYSSYRTRCNQPSKTNKWTVTALMASLTRLAYTILPIRWNSTYTQWCRLWPA